MQLLRMTATIGGTAGAITVITPVRDSNKLNI
jgi:hypothetical protein